MEGPIDNQTKIRTRRTVCGWVIILVHHERQMNPNPQRGLVIECAASDTSGWNDTNLASCASHFKHDTARVARAFE